MRDEFLLGTGGRFRFFVVEEDFVLLHIIILFSIKLGISIALSSFLICCILFKNPWQLSYCNILRRLHSLNFADHRRLVVRGEIQIEVEQAARGLFPISKFLSMLDVRLTFLFHHFSFYENWGLDSHG